MIRQPSLCDSCIHMSREDSYGVFDDMEEDDRPDIMDQYLNVNMKCNAFPMGIPEEILNGDFDHREPHPADDGVRYTLEPGRENMLLAYDMTKGVTR